jgi:hypothetical protein
MSYVGITPQVGQYRKMDSLTFNGTDTLFNITVGGTVILEWITVFLDPL